jgi:cell division protein FtsZ
MMQFELPKERPSIIKVIGVGGGGSNAVNHMYRLGIKGVDFLVCNTDHQALEISPVPLKIQLGPSLTEGRGAGSMPEVGKNAAIENIEEIRSILRDNTKMVFITAGMGGGTGTGAAPIIAGIAREMGILTVAIVTIPFSFEGKKRKGQADLGIEELKRNVDTLLVICNDKLREIHGDLKLRDAFGYADNILATAAKSIAEIISKTLHINVDFADVQTVMKESGVAIMGSAIASGDNRAMVAVKNALDSPLLNDNNIEGARYILLNITSGDMEVTMDEMAEITDYIQEQAGMSAEVIMGVGNDESLGEGIGVTIIATGFKTKDQFVTILPQEEKKVVYDINGGILNNEKEILPTAVQEQKINVIPQPAGNPVQQPVQQQVATPVPNTNLPAREPQKPEPTVIYYLNEEETVVKAEEAPPVADNEPQLIIKENIQKEKESEKTFIFDVASPVLNENKTENKPAEPVRMPLRKDIEEEKTEEDPYQRAKNRINLLREMSMKMNTPGGINDLEKEPAYKRKNIKLADVPSSDDSQVSRFTLSNDQDNKPEIRPNNTFLHDRVD